QADRDRRRRRRRRLRAPVARLRLDRLRDADGTPADERAGAPRVDALNRQRRGYFRSAFERYAVRAFSTSGAGMTVARILNGTCCSTCTFGEGRSSPQTSVTSVPGSANSPSTVPSDRMRRTLAEEPVHVEIPMTFPFASIRSAWKVS